MYQKGQIDYKLVNDLIVPLPAFYTGPASNAGQVGLESNLTLRLLHQA